MSRSIWKPTFLHSQVRNAINSSEILVQNRATQLTPSMIGQRFQVYNGIRWFPIEINQERLGHRLGEFAPTRKRPIPKKKIIKKKKN